MGPVKGGNSEYCVAPSGDPTESEMLALCSRAWVGEQRLADEDP